MYILSGTVSPKEATAFRLDSALLKAMRSVKEREGIPVTTQLEMAAREWLQKKGITVKPERSRRSGRKRS